MKNNGLKLKITAIILTLLIAVSLFASCGAKSDNWSGGDAYMENSAPVPSDKGEGSSNGLGTVPSGGIDNPSAKIIKKATAEMQTTEYDKFLNDLYTKITEFEGYTDGESFSGSGKYRRATVTIRIPAAKLEDFKAALSGLGTMTYYSATKQDVTLTYDILKSEVDTLTAEIVIVEELFEIAKANGDLARITEVEEKLTDLRLRIAKANAQLSVYDNSISYSTVNLTVYEKAVIEEPEPEPDPTAFQRIGKNLSNAFKGIGEFFVDLFVFIVSAIPYLLVISLFACVPVIIIVRRIKKKNGNGKDNKNNSTVAETGKNQE